MRQRKGGVGRDINSGELVPYKSKPKPYFKPGDMLVGAVERGIDKWVESEGPDEDDE